MAAEHPGKSWHDWFIEDFLRYSFWPIVLFESLFVSSIISYLTGVSQFDPLLLGSTTALMLAVEYYYIYRRIWGSIRKKHNDDESDIAPGDIFDRIK